MWRKLFFLCFGVSILLLTVLAIATISAMRPLPTTLTFDNAGARKVQVRDRHRTPLTITYQNHWNLHDYKALHAIPDTLQKLFILAEDKRFFTQSGVDWHARFHAIFQNLQARRAVRGASTITEQAVRMLNPRPRTLWSRWVEGFEAMRLETKFAKAAILEFYLNQVPYAAQRRGVVQAARYYFDRDLDTLNYKEMLALAVLVRSPSRLDLRRNPGGINKPLQRLATRAKLDGLLTQIQYTALSDASLELNQSHLPVQALHFVHHIYQSDPPTFNNRLDTTLDATLQQLAQTLLDNRIGELTGKNVQNGAVLIVNHTTREVLAWVNAGNLDPAISGSRLDAVTTPRQPGSTLKPFLYALALQQGWTAATLVNDAPLLESVGTGLHDYRNYSRRYYGPLRLRDALGNSLNTPAVRTVQFTGATEFLNTLQALGIEQLQAHPDFYGDGLALGNGAITLFELTQAYATLAGHGVFKPLQVLLHDSPTRQQQVFSPEVSSLIADILSDPDARRLEFGRSHLLRFPVQTAVKTGTSNDYRDAWAVGFNYRYTIGVWLGNLDQTPMRQVSGASGPALLLRSLFAELNRREETQPLYLSPRLTQMMICRDTGLMATDDCAARPEWFQPGAVPATAVVEVKSMPPAIRLRQPVNGLQLALDPRIPDADEAFMMRLPDSLAVAQVEWWVDNALHGRTGENVTTYLWPLSRGIHTAQAKVWRSVDNTPEVTPVVTFEVR